jgi:hypothetical protein
MGLVMIERANRPRRVAARRLDFDHIGARASQKFSAKLAFFIGKL